VIWGHTPVIWRFNYALSRWRRIYAYQTRSSNHAGADATKPVAPSAISWHVEMGHSRIISYRFRFHWFRSETRGWL